MTRLFFIFAPGVFNGFLAFMAARQMGADTDGALFIGLLIFGMCAGIGWSATTSHREHGEGNPHDPR